MANCSIRTGMLFWKKDCIHPSLGNCARCRKFVCQIHSAEQRDGTVLCYACAQAEENRASGASIVLGSAIGALTSSASATDADAGSSSSDSGSSDSGSSSDSSSSSSSD